MSRRPEAVEADIARKKQAFAKLKSSSSGFRFGEGKIAQKEARRRRDEIVCLETELAKARRVHQNTAEGQGTHEA